MKNFPKLLNTCKNYCLQFTVVAFMSFFLFSCSKGSSKKDETIDPRNAAQLGAALEKSFPTGTKKQSGTLPSPSLGSGPSISPTSGSTSSVTSGSQTSFSFALGNQGSLRLSSTSQQYAGGCYVSLPGYTGFWNVPAPQNTTTLTLPITIPSNIASGTFSLQICVYTPNGYITNIITWNIIVINPSNSGGGGGLGSGSANISINGASRNSNLCVFSNNPNAGSGDVDAECITNVLTIGLDNNSSFLYLYNIPTGASGSSSIVNYCSNISDNTNCTGKTFAIYVDGSEEYAVSISGTFTKTSGNGFRISNLVVRGENENDNTYNDDCGYSGIQYNIAGTGTYVAY